MTTKNILNEEREVEVSVSDGRKPKMWVQGVYDLAIEYDTAKKELAERKRILEEELKPSMEYVDKLEEKLLQAMETADIKRQDVGNGEYYVREKTDSFEVADQEGAEKFAKRRSLMRIDKTAINSFLRKEYVTALKEVPKAFRHIKGWKLSLKKPKESSEK